MLAEQSKVLNPAQIEEHLQNAADPTNSNRSAMSFPQQAKDLQKAKEDLQKIQAQQQQVEKAAEANAPAAKPQEEQVAAALAKVDDGRDLPAAVDTRLAQAEEAAQKAAQALAESPPQPTPSAQQTLDNAQEAIELAAAETQAALADTQRRELAVKVGELARAAKA